jgi:hypothetical protein
LSQYWEFVAGVVVDSADDKLHFAKRAAVTTWTLVNDIRTGWAATMHTRMVVVMVTDTFHPFSQTRRWVVVAVVEVVAEGPQHIPIVYAALEPHCSHSNEEYR